MSRLVNQRIIINVATMKIKQPTFLARSMYDINNMISLAELNKEEISAIWNKEKLEQMITLCKEYQTIMTNNLGEKLMTMC